MARFCRTSNISSSSRIRSSISSRLDMARRGIGEETWLPEATKMRPAAALLACLPAVAAKVDADKITKLPGYAPGAPATDQYSGASNPQASPPC